MCSTAAPVVSVRFCDSPPRVMAVGKALECGQWTLVVRHSRGHGNNISSVVLVEGSVSLLKLYIEAFYFRSLVLSSVGSKRIFGESSMSPRVQDILEDATLEMHSMSQWMHGLEMRSDSRNVKKMISI